MTTLFKTASITKKNDQTTVFVALSGGVDSAVVAILAQQKYQNVIGFSHQHWPESRCCSTACLDRCEEQCRRLGIPYYRIDTMIPFAQNIVDNFIEEYEKGRVPNPCVRCNQMIRFDQVIQDLLNHPELSSIQNYKIATGHYVQILKKKDTFFLKEAVDFQKDQSYMLYRLGSQTLSHCYFPLGTYLKKQVREIADQYGLLSAKVGDSQDICFVEKDYRSFIDQYTQKQRKKGFFLDLKGAKLGEHNGSIYYTRGQRRGLGLSGGPWYVIQSDISLNTVTLGCKKDLEVKQFDLIHTIWYRPFENDTLYTIKVRYHGRDLKAFLTELPSGKVGVLLKTPCWEVCPGQSAVIYQNKVIIGGGVIDSLKKEDKEN